MPDVLEDDRAIRTTLADVSIGECEDVEVDVAIWNESAVLILAKRMVDHQPAQESMLLGDVQSDFPLDLEWIHVRERDHTMNAPGVSLRNTPLDSDVLTASPESPTVIFRLF
jgi:hypothetical protein